MNIIKLNDENRYQYLPNHPSRHDAIGYIKGQNGHYYLIEGWNSYSVIRLYMKNQINESTYLGRIDSDDINKSFIDIVSSHKPYHHVPKNRDVQRRACYRWEADFGNELLSKGNGTGFCNEEAARKYVQIISNKEGLMTVPKMKFSKKGSCSWAKMDTELKFLMSDDGLISCKTIIHEMAHIVDFARHRGGPSREAGHGPSFIGIYIDMLVRYLKLDKDYLESKARANSLKFSYDKVVCLQD